MNEIPTHTPPEGVNGPTLRPVPLKVGDTVQLTGTVEWVDEGGGVWVQYTDGGSCVWVPTAALTRVVTP